MQVRDLPREISRGARTAAALSSRPEAVEAAINERVKLVRRWRRAMAMGLSSREAAAAVGVSRATLYRWRHDPEPRSRRPRRVRQRQWSQQQVRAVAAFRCQYPAWGQAEDRPSAASSRQEGQLRRLDLGRDRRPHPGLPGRHGPCPARLVLYRRGAQAAPAAAETSQTPARSPQGQQTGRRSADRHSLDLVSQQPHRQAVHRRQPLLEVGPGHGRQSGHRRFRQALPRPPDRAGALRGSGHPGRWRQRVHGRLRADLQGPGLELCVLPPRSPQLNGRVERLQATYRDEFYGSYTLPHRIEPLNRCLDDFNHHYNRQRSHQALGGLTPWQYELAPVSWTLHPCRRRYPRCRERGAGTRQSTGSRWWIWSGPGVARTI
ncbi:MAG: transposase [Holophagales bacterium]|nr:transposase [Holophagales bacterium]MYI80712.1 transposase [Holophagales bacterium]